MIKLENKDYKRKKTFKRNESKTKNRKYEIKPDRIFKEPTKFKKRPVNPDEEKQKTNYSGTKFDDLNLSEGIIKALNKKEYVYSSTVQSDVIPPLMEYKDVIAKAPTGTGKTYAFGIPLLEQLDYDNKEVQALILAPTRELVIQICEELKDLSEFIPRVKIEAIYGGKAIESQIKALKRNPQIIVATPGRLKDHIERKTINISNVRTAVLDEADRMLDMGFIEEVTNILNMMPNRRNLALLSATMSIGVMDISWLYQRDAVEVTVEENNENKPDIDQFYVMVQNMRAKIKAVDIILDNNEFYKVLIFCNTINMVRMLTDDLREKGYSASCIYGGKSQAGREKTIKAFKEEKLNILIATDVAARGLDITDVDAVINFDLPDDKEQYIHRIGRTGRAMKNGIALSLLTPFDQEKLDDIIKFSKANIKEIENDNMIKIIKKEDFENDN
ncbi:MAG TPA: DEAD/DEAH box helicase [Clostridia bacterium]|nr:MAG: DEAD-box ATP-dependent RNA helicase CshA [Firmicutes bacterium ADurb.Bin146]HOD92534.1 DEAD/DEAH box helicase [Clostridia bacterium]HQM39192.1 DEAD/DEAH box helicase [Clostridia bacterium]